MKIRSILFLASGPLAVLTAYGLSLYPAVAEQGYSRLVYPLLAKVLGFGGGLVPVPLAMLVAICLGAACLVIFGRAIVRGLGPGLARSSPGFLGSLAHVVFRLLSLVSVLVAGFMILWGFNYQRQSWAENHGWIAASNSAPAQTAELWGLVENMASALSRDRAELAENRHGLAVPAGDSWTGQAMLQAVGRAWDAAARQDQLLMDHSAGAKYAWFSDLFSRFFVAGIFIPFTGEALVNAGPNDFSVPFAAAHEIAHQRGWAREDEANFIAFFVLQSSPAADLRYAARASASLYLFQALEASGQLTAPQRLKLKALFPAGFWRDWQANHQYWQKFQGPLSTAGTAINDGYLKTQGMAEGVLSYGRMVDLLLIWNRL